MTHDEMIAVIAAHRDLKAVQWRLKSNIGQWNRWFDCPPDHKNWNFVVADFRIKPEPPKPREWWIVAYKDGSVVAGEPYFAGHPVGCIFVREVLPSTGEPPEPASQPPYGIFRDAPILGIGPIRIAKALRTRARNYTATATSASKRGDVIECVLYTAKADIFIALAEEFEHEAGR